MQMLQQAKHQKCRLLGCSMAPSDLLLCGLSSNRLRALSALSVLPKSKVAHQPTPKEAHNSTNYFIVNHKQNICNMFDVGILTICFWVAQDLNLKQDVRSSSQHFMEPDGSLPSLQELSTCTYP
jgi:hypothetical protein